MSKVSSLLHKLRFHIKDTDIKLTGKDVSYIDENGNLYLKKNVSEKLGFKGPIVKFFGTLIEVRSIQTVLRNSKLIEFNNASTGCSLKADGVDLTRKIYWYQK